MFSQQPHPPDVTSISPSSSACCPWYRLSWHKHNHDNVRTTKMWRVFLHHFQHVVHDTGFPGTNTTTTTSGQQRYGEYFSITFSMLSIIPIVLTHTQPQLQDNKGVPSISLWAFFYNTSCSDTQTTKITSVQHKRDQYFSIIFSMVSIISVVYKQRQYNKDMMCISPLFLAFCPCCPHIQTRASAHKHALSHTHTYVPTDTAI